MLPVLKLCDSLIMIWQELLENLNSIAFFPFIPKLFVHKRNNYLFRRDRASVIFPYVVRGTGQFFDISLKTENSANKTSLLKVTLINVALRRTTMSEW